MIMNSIRFIIGLAGLLLVILIFLFFTQPFAPENIIERLIDSLGILVAGLIWGILFWVPIRMIKGTDTAPDLQHFLFYSAAIFTALYVAWHFIG